MDGAGNTINTQHDWMFARNQQRNWETVLQCMSLRTQPQHIQYPTVDEVNLENFQFKHSFPTKSEICSR